MKIHDISMDVGPGMLHYGRRPEVYTVEAIATGHAGNVSRWLIGSHTGTHIDAQRHFVEGGGTVDTLPLEELVGPVRVVDLANAPGQIDAALLEAAGLDGATRVLIRTSNSTRDLLDVPELVPDYIGVEPDAAQLLVDSGVRFVGLDYITIESHANSVEWPVHHILCDAGVTILEGADLRNVSDGTYFMCCLPVPLVGSEAAPARTVLIEGL